MRRRSGMPGKDGHGRHHVQKVAKYFFGTRPILYRFQSCWNEVYRLDFGGRIPDKVIKVGQLRPRSGEGDWGGYGEVLREQGVIRALAARGFEVPEIEFTQDDYHDAPIPFSIMPFYAGKTLSELYRDNPHAARKVIRRTRQLSIRLGKIKYAEIGIGFGPKVVQRSELSCWQAVRKRFQQHPLYSPLFDRAFARVRDVLESEPQGFGHRDGIQVIADGSDVFVAIDWGPAGATWRLVDLARRIHLWTLYDADYGRNSNGLAHLIAKSQTTSVSDGSEQVELSTWRIYNCLRDAMFFESEGRETWTRDLIGLAERLASSSAA